MKNKELHSRRDDILNMIIDTYVATANPVASRAISRKLRSNLSPATIRNVMSDLEEMGLITHPHTSAGRIPTEKGYRYYVSKLMQAKLLTEEEKRQINKEFRQRVSELDSLLDITAKILSSITNQTGLVLFPVIQKNFFSHSEIIKINANRLLVVLMTGSGLTEDIMVDIDTDLDNNDLQRISNFINSHMGSGSLIKVRRDIMQRLIEERDSFFFVLDRAKKILDGMLDMVKEDRIYLDGRLHLARQPEFNEVSNIRRLFSILEDKGYLCSILKKGLDEDGVKVYIGSELSDGFSGYSMVTANYSIGENPCGTLGIMGPSRMDYSKLVSVVDYVASNLSRVLG